MRNNNLESNCGRTFPCLFWRLRLFLPTPCGLKRRNFNLGYRDETTRQQANQKGLEVLAKADRGELCDSGGMTFRALAEESVELRLPFLKVSTADFYRQR